MAKRPPSCGPPPKLGALAFPIAPPEDEGAVAGLATGTGGRAIEPLGAVDLTSNSVHPVHNIVPFEESMVHLLPIIGADLSFVTAFLSFLPF